MKAQVVDGWPRGNAIRVLLTDTDASQVNAIRRAMIRCTKVGNIKSKLYSRYRRTRWSNH